MKRQPAQRRKGSFELASSFWCLPHISDQYLLPPSLQVDTVVFDKTGTLTESQPSVQRVIHLTEDNETGLSPTAVLAAVMAAESSSEHPIGKAIFKYGQKASFCIHPCAVLHALVHVLVTFWEGSTSKYLESFLHWLVRSFSSLLGDVYIARWTQL